MGNAGGWLKTGIRVRVNNQLSAPFMVKGISTTLFLTVMDSLLKRLKQENYDLSEYGTYVGAAVHVDTTKLTPSANLLGISA